MSGFASQANGNTLQNRRYGAKYKQLWWEHAYSMITIFLGTNFMYLLLIAFTSISNDSTPKAFLSMLFLVSLIIVGSAGFVINCSYAQLSATTTNSRENKCDYSLTIVAFILVPSLPFYLMWILCFLSMAAAMQWAMAAAKVKNATRKKVKVTRVQLLFPYTAASGVVTNTKMIILRMRRRHS